MKKRLLLLSHEFPPVGWGGWIVAYNIAMNLLSLGYEIDVVTMNCNSEVIDKPIPWLGVFRVNCFRRNLHVSYVYEQIIFLLKAYFLIKRLHKEQKYDFCHCHFIIPWGILAYIIYKHLNIPYVLSAHWSDVLWHNPRFSFLYKVIEGFWKRIIQNSKYLFSPTKFLEHKIKKIISFDGIQIIPHGINEALKLDLQNKEKYILVVSRLVKNKWVEDLIEAVWQILHFEWKIKIMWSWPMRDELWQLVIKHELEEKIEFLWWQEQWSHEFQKAFEKASVYFSWSRFESFGLTMIEAMSYWCAIIASDIPAFREILPETSAVFYESWNTQQLAQIIQSLTNDPQLIENMKENNIHNSKSFNRQNITWQYNNLFEKYFYE